MQNLELLRGQFQQIIQKENMEQEEMNRFLQKSNYDLSKATEDYFDELEQMNTRATLNENSDRFQEIIQIVENQLMHNYPLLLGSIELICQYIPISSNLQLKIDDQVNLKVEFKTINQKKKKQSIIYDIRIQTKDKEIGRLQQDLSSILGPLMKNKFIYIEKSKIKQCPLQYEAYSKFEITCSIYLTEYALAQDQAETLSQNKQNFVQLFNFLQQGKLQQQIECKDIQDILNQNEQINFNKLIKPHKNVKSNLYEFQEIGFNWMLYQEQYQELQKRYLPAPWEEIQIKESKISLFFNTLTGQIQEQSPQRDFFRNGADEMGLGKTLLSICLIHTNKYEQNAFRKSRQKFITQKCEPQTLIIVPLSLMDQWHKEIIKHSQQKTLKICEFYGQDRDQIILSEYDVILTTYNILTLDMNKSKILFKNRWFRIILDEAHQIKSKETQQAKACYALQAQFRWCITGTPIQNKLDDLFSYFHFLQFQPFDKFNFFQQNIIKPHEQKDKNFQQRLKNILNSILLRRTKTNAENQIKLEQKHYTVEYISFEQQEQEYYNKLFISERQKYIENISQGNLSHIFSKLIKLRQFCDNKILSYQKQSFTDIEKSIKKFIEKRQSQKEDLQISQNYYQQIIEKIENSELDQCSICFDDLEDAVITCCMHIMCKFCILQSLSHNNICPECRQSLSKKDLISLPIIKQDKVQSETMVKKSSKQKAIEKKVLEIQQKQEKCIIFTQFLGMIDLIQQQLKSLNINCLRYDGQLSKENRQQVLQEFQEDDTTALIISLKAGGVGLNLICANHVLLVDPWWNQALEQQAIERVYRIGQKKEVFVTRFIMNDSIESKILESQERKNELIDFAFRKNSKSLLQDVNKFFQID